MFPYQPAHLLQSFCGSDLKMNYILTRTYRVPRMFFDGSHMYVMYSEEFNETAVLRTANVLQMMKIKFAQCIKNYIMLSWSHACTAASI